MDIYIFAEKKIYMTTTLLIVIIGFVIFSFLLNQVLDYLNSKFRNKNIPSELEGIYDAEKYLKSQDYGLANDIFSIIESSLSTLLIMGMLTFYGFDYINDIALTFSSNEIVSALIFVGILMLASGILSIPFEMYSIFVIEEKFGFNKTTYKTFWLDKIKSFLLTFILGGVILAGFIWFYLETKELFWLYAWISLSVFSLLMAMFYSNLIVPLFNKQTPIEEGSLKQAIFSMSEKAGFKVKNIFVIDGSKRSTKANAYFTGFGPKKRIVLYDTLIKDLTEQEIVAVLAHEIGHYKKKHSLSNIAISIAHSGIMLYIFSLFIDNPALSNAMGSETVSFQLGLISFGILYSPISMILGIFLNLLSRKNEYQADNFAKQQGCGSALISALNKLSEKNLSNLTPHPLYVFFHYSHPTLYQRIKAIENE